MQNVVNYGKSLYIKLLERNSLLHGSVNWGRKDQECVKRTREYTLSPVQFTRPPILLTRRLLHDLYPVASIKVQIPVSLRLEVV